MMEKNWHEIKEISMDKINITIEIGGYTITGVAGKTGSHIYAGDKTKPAWTGVDRLYPFGGRELILDHQFFFVESDVPGKLHKFKGVEYLGLVDAPRDYQKMLKDLLEKFKGALVIFDGQYVMVVHKDTPILSGCSTIFSCLTGGGATNMISHSHVSGVGHTYGLHSSVVSLEMEAAAKGLGNEFIRNYERLMAL